MKWAYDLCGAEPIIKDEVVYDSALIDQGELLMLATGNFTVGTGQGGLITAYPSTVAANHAIDAVGISMEKKTTADTPSVATATDTTAEPCYVKTIINPFAVYRAECTTAATVVHTSWAATHMVVAGIAAQSGLLNWLYVPSTVAPNFGNLRMVTDVAANDTLDTDSAPSTTSTTADRLIFIPGKMGYSHALNAAATGIAAQSTGTTELNGATNLRVVETYIDADTGFEIMRQNKHKGMTVKKGSMAAKFYCDIVCRDHAYGVQE